MNEEIKPAVNKILTVSKTDDEKLVAFLQGKLKRTELSDALQREVERMHMCADLIRKYGSRLKVAPMLKELYGFGDQAAYSLFDRTMRIFGTSTVHDQQFWTDILLGGIMQDIKNATAKQDFRSVASLRKTMLETIEKLMGSAEASLYENIQPVLPVIGFWPEELKTGVPSDPAELKKLIDKFKKEKKRKFFEDNSQEISYEK